MEIKIAESDSDLSRISPVLLQLRPEYTPESLIAQIRRQQESGFKIAFIEVGARVVCVAGFIICEKLAWGKSIYIDDFVTDESFRSKGAGRAMIDWFKSYAREHGCSQIHLDSRMIREDAHRFYLREGFSKSSYHFSISDLDS